MEFEWDEEKAALNEQKHGVPFPFAARVFLDENRLEGQTPGGSTESLDGSRLVSSTASRSQWLTRFVAT